MGNSGRGPLDGGLNHVLQRLAVYVTPQFIGSDA